MLNGDKRVHKTKTFDFIEFTIVLQEFRKKCREERKNFYDRHRLEIHKQKFNLRGSKISSVHVANCMKWQALDVCYKSIFVAIKEEFRNKFSAKSTEFQTRVSSVPKFRLLYDKNFLWAFAYIQMMSIFQYCVVPDILMAMIFVKRQMKEQSRWWR